MTISVNTLNVTTNLGKSCFQMIATIFHGCNQYQVSRLNILFPFSICKDKMKCVTCSYHCCFLCSSAAPDLHRKKTSGKTVATKDSDDEENDESVKDTATDDSKPKDIDDDGDDTDNEDDIEEIDGDDDDSSDIQEIGSVDPEPIGDDNDGDDDDSKTESVDEVQAIDSETHDNNDESPQEQDDVNVMIGEIGDSGLLEDTGKDSDFVMSVDTGAGEYGSQKIVDYSFTESDNSPVVNDNGGNRSFTCKICGNSFMTQNGVRHHEYGHWLLRSDYKCDECGAEFFTQESLQVHVLSNHRTFKCAECSETFVSHDVLTLHVSSSHKRFQCDQCSAKFFLHAGLGHHVQSHSNIKGNAFNINPQVLISEQCMSHKVITHDEGVSKVGFKKMSLWLKRVLEVVNVVYTQNKRHRL